MLRVGAWLLSAMVAAGIAAWPARAQACAKADFETVVDEAAAALRALNQQNAAPFQVKLRQLKDKRGWSHDQFMSEAAPLVRDDTIAGFDQKSEELLGRITSGGQSARSQPDCALLEDLRGEMKRLVETQKAKWTYMFAKIEQELKK